MCCSTRMESSMMWCSGSAQTGSRSSSGPSETDVSTRESTWWPATGILIVMLTLTGCGFFSTARVTVNDPIQPDDMVFIVPGKTTFMEVVAQLGTPDELTGMAHGAVVVYHFRDAKYSRINFGWPSHFFLPVS